MSDNYVLSEAMPDELRQKLAGAELERDKVWAKCDQLRDENERLREACDAAIAALKSGRPMGIVDSVTYYGLNGSSVHNALEKLRAVKAAIEKGKE